MRVSCVMAHNWCVRLRMPNAAWHYSDPKLLQCFHPLPSAVAGMLGRGYALQQDRRR